MDDLEKLEKLLGKTFERNDNRVIPGTVRVEGQKVIYLRDDGTAPTAAQFRRVSRKVDPPHLKSGGASECKCTITTPDNMRLFSWSYHGDLDGWDRELAQGARELAVITAVIDGDVLRRSDGYDVPLTACRVEFS